MADFDREIDKAVEGKFLIIDKKLKEAFTSVKKDLSEVKASIDKKDKTPAPEKKVDTKQIEDKIELLNEEIERLSALSIKSPKVDNEKLKLEKEILQLKIKEAREAQKNNSTGRISRLINRIGVWKEKHKLNKQYRKQLEQINNKHDEFEQELIEKTKQLDKLYSNSTKKAENKFEETTRRIEQEREIDKQLLTAQKNQIEREKSELSKEHSRNLYQIERRFEKLIDNIESKRREDNSALANQLSVISQDIAYNRKRTEKTIEELRVEIEALKNKKVRDEKKIQQLQEELEVKNARRTSRSFSLPKFNMPKINLPKLNVNSNDVKSGFWMAVPYIFLAILAIVALNQYFRWDIVSLNTTYWIVAGVLFGGLTFWHNRDKIESSMEDEKKTEELNESKRASEFEYRFPRINRIWGLRSIVKWMYKEGFWYSIGLIAIVVVGFVLRTATLLKEVKSVWYDESISLIVAHQINIGAGHTFLSGDLNLKSYLYHEYLSLLTNLDFSQIVMGTLANTPFFLISVTIIYIWGKRFFQSKKIGLLASFLFVFTYFSIEMFQDIRFYEMFVSFVIISLFLMNSFIHSYFARHPIFKVSNILNYLRSKNGLLPNYILFLLILITAWIAYDTTNLYAFILYPILFFGLLIFVFNRRIEGVYICVISFLLILLGNLYIHKDSFKIIYLIKQPFLPWFTETPHNIFEFTSYLMQQGFGYIILMIPILIILIYLNKKDTNILFLSSLSIGLYFMIAYQGYGLKAARYFYMFLPFFVLTLAYTLINLEHCFINYQKRIFKIIVVIILIILFNISFIQSYNQYASDNLELSNFLKNQKEINNSVIITDFRTAAPYFIYFNKTPNYIISTNPSGSNITDSLTGVRVYNFREIKYLTSKLSNLTSNKYIIYRTDRGDNAELDKVLDSYESVFDNRKIKVVLIN